MKNSKRKPLVRWILLALLLILALLLLIHRYTVRQVWCNVFSPTLPLDESADWAGGKSYERLRYAEDSEAQYIDLYVPDTEEGAPLFVLIHGGGFAFNDAQSRQAQFMYRYFRDRGFACASVNYRLSTEAAYPAATCDVKAAVRFLCHNAEEYGIHKWGHDNMRAPDSFPIYDTLCSDLPDETRCYWVYGTSIFQYYHVYYGDIAFVAQNEDPNKWDEYYQLFEVTMNR